MKNEKSLFGCFASISSGPYDCTTSEQEKYIKQGMEFRDYLWGENGLSHKLSKYNYIDYGIDLKIILFQFYVNPISELESELSDIEKYRKKEKSIGMPIIINQEKFFKKCISTRDDFIKKEILKKLDLLGAVIASEKLDTNVEKIKLDLSGAL